MFERSIRVEFEGVDIRPIENLRVSFEIEKNNGLQFNHGFVTIYNMSTTNRHKIARPFPLGFPMSEPVIKVLVYAGYKDNEVLLLAGDVLSATNEKRGPDFMTIIDVYSGLDNATKAESTEAFSLPTDAKVISDRLLLPLGLDVKYTPEAIRLLQNKRPSDFSASGLSIQEATTFLSRYGLAFTIEENGQGLVYVDNRPRNPDTGKNNGNTFKPENGLVGTPKITRSGVDLKCLLRPRLRLFEKIFVESRTIQETLQTAPDYSPEYHIIGLKHLGDTRGDDWHTELECVYSSLADGVY